MALSSEQLANLSVSKLVAQSVEAFVHGWQGHLHVRLPGLCTNSVCAVVGQHQMGQAAQVEVSLDSILAQHLVITQPQVTPQFLKQNLDCPALLVDRHDRSPRKLGFVCRKRHHGLPKVNIL